MNSDERRSADFNLLECVLLSESTISNVFFIHVCVIMRFVIPYVFWRRVQYRNIYEVKVTTSCNSRLIGRINLQSLSSRREDENAFTFGQVERLIFTTIDVSTKLSRYFTVRRIGRYQRASVKIPNRIWYNPGHWWLISGTIMLHWWISGRIINENLMLMEL